MKNFVITTGIDCDGFFTPSIDRYETEEIAMKVAKESMDWSDGLLYFAVDEAEAIAYAAQYNLQVPDFFFDADGDIRHIEL